MKTKRAVLTLTVLIAIVMPVAAHHSFSAEYDLSKPTYMDGKVTRIQGVNPHAYVSIDVTDKSNRTVSWRVELSPIHNLIDQGWTKDTLRIGMEICVEGFPEKTGAAGIGSTSITIVSSGRVLKTPPGMWAQDVATLAAGALKEIVDPFPYTGKTSCSKRN